LALLSIFPVPGDYSLNEPARKIRPLAANKRRRAMKYICLGYIEPGKIDGMTEDDQQAMFDECFEYNNHLRANGHVVGEVPLQPPETALTLYWKNGKVATTDGPYAETKEQLGDIHILEARDLNHAIQLISQQPGFKYGLGPIEIRPVADLSEIIKESEQRRRKNTARLEPAIGRMTRIVAALAYWQPCFSFGLGKLTIGATTGQNNFQYLTQRRRPVAGYPGLYADRGNCLNGGPGCRSFAI
jgi:hypothetical protein